MKRYFPVWLLVLVFNVLLPSCNDETGSTSAGSVLPEKNKASTSLQTGEYIPEYPQRKGDAAKGLQALLTQPYVNCGLPLSVYEALPWNEAVIPAPGRQGRARTLPFSLNLWRNQAGQQVVSSNCLSCHGSTLFGELVIGLGNEFADFTINPSDLVEQAGVYVQTEAEAEVWQHYADRLAILAPYMQTRTVGVNPANNITMALIAHRDRTNNAWSDQPLLTLSQVEPPPVSVPPWWRMKKKNAMFSMGEGRGDHARIMMAIAMFCTDEIAELKAIDSYAPDIRAYIESIEAPAYPFPVIEKLRTKGEGIFNSTCSMCHGTYGDVEHYPNRLVDIELVGTDPALVDFANGEGLEFATWFNESYFGEIATAVPANAYVAPPLDGVWATGPFLHNGSVPSIRQLLDSPTRPTYWQHTISNRNDPSTYDQVDLGWQHQVLQTGHKGIQDDSARKLIYDTTLPGYSNQGHQFGDHLNEVDRTAVLEYLKTL